MPKRIAQFGKLRVRYTAFGRDHSTSVALTSVLSPSDGTGCQSAADDLAGALSNITTSAVVFTSWDSLDVFGDTLLSGPITGTVAGLHAGTGPDYRSNTLTYTGKEVALGTDNTSGNTLLRMHVYNAYPPSSGETRIPITTDPALAIVGTFLATDARFWAGFHGIKATVRSTVAQQFNAHTQKHEGA